MKITKYNTLKDGQISASAIVGGGGSSSSTTIEGGSISLNRTIWGKDDKGEDIDGSMIVNGDVSIRVIQPLPDVGDDDEEDDGTGEFEEYEEGGGNLNVELTTTTSDLIVENDCYVKNHLYINYGENDSHSPNKKCIGNILNQIETRINTNASNIEANAEEIENLKYRSTANENAIANYLPVGSIIMFNGLATQIPDGWHICDGTNGTPNLIDKFIKAGNVAGQTGGSNSVKLKEEHIPKLPIKLDNSTYDTLTGTAQYARLSKLIHTSDWVDSRVIDTGGDTNYCLSDGKNKGDSDLLGVDYKQILNDVHQFMYIGKESDSQESIDIQPEYFSLIFIQKIN